MTETAREQTVWACSFCLKSSTQVRKLVAGPGVFICDACVDLCAQIIADELGNEKKETEKKEEVPQAPLWDRIDNVEEALALLPKIAAAATQVEGNLMALVRRARTLGATWAKIGEALAMTRQSAWERFSGEE